MPSSKTRILVTGSDGFLGSHLCSALIRSGREVRSFDLKRGHDIRSYEQITRALSGCEAVFHLAADNHATQAFYDNPKTSLEVGSGILPLIDAALEHQVKDLIVASSSEVYGEPWSIPTPETHPVQITDIENPRFAYAASKIFAESAALTAKGFRKVQVFRPFNLYGPGQRRGHVIPDLIHEAREADNIMIVKGNPGQTRAFCHVSDAVDAILAMWEHGSPGVYNVGNDTETRIDDLARMIGPTKKLMFEIPPRGSPGRRCPDITRLRLLGYQPKIALHDGIEALWGEEHAAHL